MAKRKVLVVGGGAREHALAWSIARSGNVALQMAPGNGGTEAIATSVPIRADDVGALVRHAESSRLDLVVIGPDAPAVLGLADLLRARGIATFGPSKAAARIEGSKAFAKDLMRRARVPTAAYEEFTTSAEAEAYVRAHGGPLVVKADGLALGKGVTVCDDTESAVRATRASLDERVFGDAGARVVIEERLVGPEVSVHVLASGTSHVMLAPAQDHKRAYDGDHGPNTGGMGAYSPVPIVDDALLARIEREVVAPTLAQLVEDGTPFTGALFVGLMIVDGAPRVLEYNARFGDPEGQTLLARARGSILPALEALAAGEVPDPIALAYEASATVVLAAKGYPGTPATGDPITGLAAAEELGVHVFHAGTRREGDAFVTAGGRVLSLTAAAATLDEAVACAYGAAERVSFDGKHFRRDIAAQALRAPAAQALRPPASPRASR